MDFLLFFSNAVSFMNKFKMNRMLGLTPAVIINQLNYKTKYLISISCFVIWGALIPLFSDVFANKLKKKKKNLFGSNSWTSK